MSIAGLSKALDYLRLELLPDAQETDGQLLARFTTGRDEIAFAALVRRYEPLVFGVCRRVLRNHHDAEDAFQATFLVLARKAANVSKRETLGCWLSRVAYHVALEVRAVNARRQAREIALGSVLQPEVYSPEPQDWRSLLDQELNKLPNKYRTVVVLCELEGRPRKEAAELLGLPEGTLSSRLAMARRMLGERLVRRGFALTATALSTALSPSSGSAASTVLITTTIRTAVLVGAGQSAAVTTPAAILMNGVLKAMFLQKLKVTSAAILMTAALGFGGFVYQASSGPNTAHAQAAPAKPLNELEVLRKENELLKLNLQVVLEKVRAQEAELRAKKSTTVTTADNLTKTVRDADMQAALLALAFNNRNKEKTAALEAQNRANSVMAAEMLARAAKRVDPLAQVETAIKAWRDAKDAAAKARAAEALENATKKLREQLKQKEGAKPEQR